MKSLVVLTVCAVFVMALPHLVQAEDQYNTKVLFHGARPLADSSFVHLAGWAVFPNIGNGPVLMLGGVGYAVPNQWGIEVLVGFFSKDQAGEPVLDFRGSYDAWDPVHVWTNLEYYPKTGNLYAYVETNIRIGSYGLVGIETENLFFPSAADDVSVGPRLVLPCSDKLVFIGAYQWHLGDSPNQVWIRAVLHF